MQTHDRYQHGVAGLDGAGLSLCASGYISADVLAIDHHFHFNHPEVANRLVLDHPSNDGINLAHQNGSPLSKPAAISTPIQIAVGAKHSSTSSQLAQLRV